MNEEAQKRILSYFIEEARDHLTTIEQVLLSLRDSMHDTELINELFRAAHSIKGGSAMLGLTSIQRTAHRMEDFFNVFRSHPGGVPVDQHLETLLLRSFDGLSMLLEELQSPRGLTEEVGNATLAELEPIFQETEKHIQNLLGEGSAPSPAPTPAPVPPLAARTLQQDMTEVVPQRLRQMLELFKQRDQPDIRERLTAVNRSLAEIGQVHHLSGWQQLTETIGQAIQNPDTDLRNLALIALRDLKQAQQFILEGKPEQVAASVELQLLARPAAPSAPPDPLEVLVQQQIPPLLRQMLDWFKRPDDLATRPALQSLAQSLQEVGQAEALDLGGWTALTRLIGEILADPGQDLRQLALPVLRDLKHAHQALASGSAHTIQPSAELLAFRPVPAAPAEPEVPDTFDLGFVWESESEVAAEPEPLFPEPDSMGAPEDWAAAAGIPTEDSFSPELSWDPEPLPEESTPVGASQWDGSEESLLPEMESAEAAWDLLEEQPAAAEPELPLEVGNLPEDLFSSAREESLDLSWSEVGSGEAWEPEIPAETPGEDGWGSWDTALEADLTATPDSETAAAPQESPEPEESFLEDTLDADLAFALEDFDATPLGLEEEASTAFDDLFANAEELSGIEEPPPDLLPPSPEPFPEDLEELSQRLEEVKAEGDLADLFAEVVDEAVAESLPAEPAEFTWAGEASESAWDTPTPLETEPLTTWPEPIPEEPSPSALDFLTYSQPTPEWEATAASSPTETETSPEEPLSDLWMGEEPTFTLTESEDLGTGSGLMSETEELPGENLPTEEGLEFPDFGEDLWGAEPSHPMEEVAADFLSESPAGMELDDFSAPVDLSQLADLGAEFSAPDEMGSLEFPDSLAFDAAEDSLESLFSIPASEVDQSGPISEAIESSASSAEVASFFADEPFPTLEEFASAPDSPLASSNDQVEFADSDLVPEPEIPDFGVELSFEDLFSSETPEEMPTAEVEAALENPVPDPSEAWGAAEAQDWGLLEDIFPAQEETFVEPQSTDLGGIAASTETSFDRPDRVSGAELHALFTQEGDTEGLNLEATGSLSAIDADGDGQVDLEELSQFFAEEEATTGFAALDSGPEPLETDSPAEVLLPEPELLTMGMQEDSAPQRLEDDLESQLAGLFEEDGFFAEPNLTVPVSGMESLDVDALEAPSGPRLDDLAALFDEGDTTATLDEVFAPALRSNIDPIAEPTTPVSSDAGSDFEAQLESLLGDLDTAPKAPVAQSLPTPTVAAPVTAPTPRRTAAFSNPVMRVEVRHLDSINNLVGELVVNRNSMEQNQTRLRQFLDGLLGRVQQLGDLGQQMRDQYDRSLLESALFSSRSSSAYSRAATVGSSRYREEPSQGSGRTGHSSGQEFDKLEMDQFTTFHALAQEIIELIVRVRESSSDIEFAVDEAEQITRQFRQVTTQLQEGLNRARMVPFSQIADRLPRAIRDLSIKTGKQANLVVDGRDTLIDKAILEELYDPMTHLVNNALVHGIETPEERRRAGKSPEGKITIKAFYQGNQTIMVVSDDGGGIPVEKVKAKAQRLGLLSEQADEDEVFNVLFNPGFSARDEGEVDDLAGRGVGLDVVRRNISELRGSIQVDSVRGKGTTFTIRLPLTLSISKAMVCVSNKALMAFPLDGVEEMLDIPADEVQIDEQGRPSIPWRDQRLHFQPLSDLLTYSRSHNRSRSEVYSISQDEGIIPIVILQSAGQYVALQVDSFVEEQEIVIKQLRGPVAKPPGISGATVLGNGRVLPIADIIELVDMAHGRRRDLNRFWLDNRGDEPTPEEVHQTTVLIVDDSVTVRELLSMSFQKVGYRVEQARDGQDAWEKLRGGLPCDLIFCDIEMPRMDGLELLTRLREDSTLNHLPIAMLTSRGAERHRQTARELGATAYFTKPYLEEELLSAAARMLEGEQLLLASPAS